MLSSGPAARYAVAPNASLHLQREHPRTNKLLRFFAATLYLSLVLPALAQEESKDENGKEEPKTIAELTAYIISHNKEEFAKFGE